MRLLRRWLLPALLIPTLALTPTLARAANAGEIVYEEGGSGLHNEPTLPSPKKTSSKKETPSPPSEPGNESHLSTSLETGEEAPSADPAPRAEPRPKKKHPDPDARHRATSEIGATKPVENVESDDERPSPTEADASTKTSGGGSSPVVPLLIAVSVLALISIGVARHQLNR